MDVNNIEDVLNLSDVLTQVGHADAAHSPYLIAALIEWADNRANQASSDSGLNSPAAKVTQAKVKRGKATESKDSDEGFTPTPDPSSDEPDF